MGGLWEHSGTDRRKQGRGVGVGVARNRRFLGGIRVEFLRTPGVGVSVGFFVRHGMSNWIISCITLLQAINGNSCWNPCWNGTIYFQTFIETENSCSVPRFSLIACCCKIVDSQTSLRYVKGWEAGVAVGNQSRKCWKGRSWSRTFYLRLRNPGRKAGALGKKRKASFSQVQKLCSH